MLRVGLVIGVLVIAGCSTEQRVARLADDCVAYGFEPGTPEFAQCLQLADIQYQQNPSQRQAAAAAYNAAIWQ